MNEKDTVLEDAKKAARIEIDSYTLTIRGLYAFCAAACFDVDTRSPRQGAKYSAGRRMHTIAENKRLTPDLVVQLDAEHGIVGEVRKNMSLNGNNLDHRLDKFDQVGKYSGDLFGWWTADEKISQHDLVLLTDDLSGVDAADAYAVWRQAGKELSRPFAIVEFADRKAPIEDQLFLRKREGSLTPKNFDEQLRRGIAFPLSQLTSVIGQIKFYDSRPSSYYITQLLYDSVLPQFMDQTEFESSDRGLRKTVRVTLPEILAYMRNMFCPKRHDDRCPSLPEKRWLTEAVDYLVEVGLARVIAAKREEYAFRLKPNPKKDTTEFLVETFTKYEMKKQKAAKSPKQGSLFDLLAGSSKSNTKKDATS